jgi:hypothetical protein
VAKDTHTDTKTQIKYAVEMGSGAKIYISCFIKTDSDIQKFIGEVHRHTETDRMETA